MTKIFNRLLFLSIILLFNSCTKSRIKKAFSELPDNEERLCPVDVEKINVYTDNPYVEEYINSDLYGLSFIDKSLALSLLSIFSRTDAWSLNSRIFIHAKIGGKEFNLSAIDKTGNSSTLLNALEKFTKNYGSSSNFYKKIIFLENQLPTRVKIHKELQKYIEHNKTIFYKDPQARKAVFKGNQIIRSGESVKRISLKKLYREHLKMSRPLFVTDNLFHDNNRFKCNFDKRLYNNPLIFKKNQRINSSISALFKDNNNYFFIISASDPLKKEYIKDTIISKSKKTHSFNAALCLNDDKFILIHNNFHSEQILNNIFKDKNLYSPSSIIQQRRWVKLLFPPRRLIEVYGKNSSKVDPRGSYYVETLGILDVIEWTGKSFRLFKDPRRDIAQCI